MQKNFIDFYNTLSYILIITPLESVKRPLNQGKNERSLK